MTSRTILIVDDDDDLRDHAGRAACRSTRSSTSCRRPTPAKGVAAARGGPIDLLIMDVGLPDMDGREAVKLLRKGGYKAPIIMLTGHDTDSDTILGLEAGANDYVTKPFRFAVLLARIRAQLRQHEQSEDATFTVGPYTFKPSQKLLIDQRGAQDPADRKGSLDHQLPLSRRPEGGDARRAAGRGLGLQFRRHDAHAGNPCLPPAPEDRARSFQCRNSCDRKRRLQAGSLTSSRVGPLAERARVDWGLMALDDDIRILSGVRLFEGFTAGPAAPARLRRRDDASGGRPGSSIARTTRPIRPMSWSAARIALYREQ